jgi:hypothetical protein
MIERQNTFQLQLKEIIRRRCEALLSQAIEAEIEEWLLDHSHLKDNRGRQRLVRNGYHPIRQVRTALGELNVSVPKSRDREASANGAAIRFQSSILRSYQRHLNWAGGAVTGQFLHSVVVGDPRLLLSGLLGRHYAAITPAILDRLRRKWAMEWRKLKATNLSSRRFVQLVGSIFSETGINMQAQCQYAVVLGLTEGSIADLLAVEKISSYREDIWGRIAADLTGRGLSILKPHSDAGAHKFAPDQDFAGGSLSNTNFMHSFS